MSVNKVILVGRLGKDPEVRHTANGTAMANLSVATSERRKKNDQWEEQTEWHKVQVWGKTVDAVSNHLHKGSEVYVEGRINTRKWQGKDGKTNYSTEITAQNVQFLGGKQTTTHQPTPQQTAEPQFEDLPF